MKPSRLLIIITAAAILACAAPVASARPASDPAGARAHVETAGTAADIAAHHEQMSQQQYLASRGQGEPIPLTDATDTDNRFPVVFFLVGISLPLAIGLGAILAKPVRLYQRHRRPPASVS